MKFNEKDPPEFSISEAKLIDVVILKDTMRVEHSLELKIMQDETPEEGLLNCYINSKEKYTLRIDGVISMMFGVILDGSRKGCVWCLGTNNVDNYPFSIAKLALVVINNLTSKYDYLYNAIPADYETGIRFAKFLGAQVDGVYITGIKMVPFYRIEFLSNKWRQ